MGFGRKIGLKTDVKNLDVEGFNKSVMSFSDKTVDIEEDILLVLSKHDQTREDGVVLLVSPVKIDPDETVKYLFLKNGGDVKYISDVKISRKEREFRQEKENTKAKKEGRKPLTVPEVVEKERFFDELTSEQIGILLEQAQVIEDGSPMNLINLLRKFEEVLNQ